MSQLLTSTNIIFAICIVFLTLIGLVIFQHSRDKVSSKFLLYLIACSIVWILSNLFANLSLFQGESYLLFFTRAALIGPSFMPFLLIMFADSFPGNKININKFFIVILSLASLIILFLIPTKYNIESVQIIDAANYKSTFMPGWLYSFFTIYLFFGIISCSIMLIKKYFNSAREQKLQIKMTLIGLLITVFIAAFASAILPIFGNTSLINYAPVAMVFFISFTTYAIIKFRLLNIRLIIAEIVSYLIVLILAVEIFFSTSIVETVFRVIFLFVAIYGATILIRSTKHEIKQKEDLAKLAKELEAANAHLKDLDKLKDDFLSMAAHELNTPIAAIEGYLSMILDEHLGGEVNPKVTKYLENMFTSAKRLSLLVHDMLNVSRIESGRIHLVYVNTPIEAVIDQAIAEIGSKAKERKHTLVFEKSAKKLPITWFDMTRITEVLINLIGNAIKYTDPGGKIEVSAEANDKFITVAVKDNGRGIAKDKEKAVFEKFTQVDILKDEVKGTGLGMYIAKKFIELHKGKIWFESSVGDSNHGTTFYFTLPILSEKPFDPHEGEGEVLH